MATPDRPPGVTRILTAAGIGYALCWLDLNALVVALVPMAEDLHADVDQIHWIIQSPYLVVAALLIPIGGVTDRVGARRVFITGLVAYGTASLLAGLSPNVEMLVVGRIAQGVGAAMLIGSAVAYLAVAYGDHPGRAPAIAMWTAVVAFVGGFGTALGGILATIDWRWIFLGSMALSVVGLVLLIGLPPTLATPGSHQRQDIWWQVQASAAAVLIVACLTESGPRIDVPAIAMGLLGLALLAAAGVRISRAGTTQHERSLLTTPGYRTGLAVAVTVNLVIYALPVTIALYLAGSLRWSPLVIGFALLPIWVTNAALRLVVGRLMRTFGSRLMIVLGMGAGAASFAILAIVAGQPVYSPPVLLVLVGCGVAISFAIPASVAVVVDAIPNELQGRGNGILNSARQAALAVGIATCSLFVDLAGTTGEAFLPIGVGGAVILVLVTAYALRPGGMRERAVETPVPVVASEPQDQRP